MCVFTLRCVHELCMFCSALVSAGGSSFTFWSPSAILTRPQKTCLIYIIWGALQQNWRKTDAAERTHAVTARCWVYCSALCAALSKSPQEDRGSFIRCSLAAAFFQNWFISVLMLLSAIGTLNCGTVPTTANSHGTLKKNTSILLDHVLCNMFVSLCNRLLIDYLFCLLIFLIYCGCCLLKPVSASCFILWTAALHESWYIYTVVVVDMVVMSTSLQWQRGTQTRGLRLLSITDQLCGVSWLQSRTASAQFTSEPSDLEQLPRPRSPSRLKQQLGDSGCFLCMNAGGVTFVSVGRFIHWPSLSAALSLSVPTSHMHRG